MCKLTICTQKPDVMQEKKEELRPSPIGEAYIINGNPEHGLPMITGDMESSPETEERRAKALLDWFGIIPVEDPTHPKKVEFKHRHVFEATYIVALLNGEVYGEMKGWKWNTLTLRDLRR